MERVFATRTGARWVDLLGKNDIPVAIVQTLNEVLDDPQVEAREMVINVAGGRKGPVRQVGIPIKLSGTPGSVRKLAPERGEDTGEILIELGYTAEEISTLRQCGVVP